MKTSAMQMRLKEEGKVRIVLTRRTIVSVISDWVFTSIFIR